MQLLDNHFTKTNAWVHDDVPIHFQSKHNSGVNYCLKWNKEIFLFVTKDIYYSFQNSFLWTYEDLDTHIWDVSIRWQCNSSPLVLTSSWNSSTALVRLESVLNMIQNSVIQYLMGTKDGFSLACLQLYSTP